MSLREEMWRYEQLTGENAEHIPIIQLGAYLDGVDKGIEKLKKIKSEIEELAYYDSDYCGFVLPEWKVSDIIYNHISELKGENKWTTKT